MDTERNLPNAGRVPRLAPGSRRWVDRGRRRRVDARAVRCRRERRRRRSRARRSTCGRPDHRGVRRHHARLGRRSGHADAALGPRHGCRARRPGPAVLRGRPRRLRPPVPAVPGRVRLRAVRRHVRRASGRRHRELLRPRVRWHRVDRPSRPNRANPPRPRSPRPASHCPPENLGSDPALDALASECYVGDMERLRRPLPAVSGGVRVPDLRRHVRRTAAGVHRPTVHEPREPGARHGSGSERARAPPPGRRSRPSRRRVRSRRPRWSRSGWATTRPSMPSPRPATSATWRRATTCTASPSPTPGTACTATRAPAVSPRTPARGAAAPSETARRPPTSRSRPPRPRRPPPAGHDHCRWRPRR